MSPRVPREFIKNLQGKEFVLLAGLLELAHQDGLKFLNTELIQAATPENKCTWIFKAVGETEKGTFSAYGDASPENVNPMLAPHAMRMAETRSIARMLRFATNVAMTAFEELGDFDKERKDPNFDESQAEQPKARQMFVDPELMLPVPPVPMSDNQKKAIYAISKSRGMGHKALESFIKEKTGTAYADLNTKQASAIITLFKEMPEAEIEMPNTFSEPDPEELAKNLVDAISMISDQKGMGGIAWLNEGVYEWIGRKVDELNGQQALQLIERLKNLPDKTDKGGIAPDLDEKCNLADACKGTANQIMAKLPGAGNKAKRERAHNEIKKILKDLTGWDKLYLHPMNLGDVKVEAMNALQGQLQAILTNI